MTNDRITVSREQLEQAVEAMGKVIEHFRFSRLGESTLEDLRRRSDLLGSFSALRAALEQPGVEPEAWYDGRKFYATPSAAHMDCADIKALRPLYEAPQAQQPVPVQEPVNIEQIAAERYKVVPTHESMFYRWAVVAGDGSQQLYIGREVDCQNMARKFAGAFLDGAYLAASQPAPAWEPVPLLTDEEVSHIAVANAIEFHEFARAIEAAVRQKAGIK